MRTLSKIMADQIALAHPPELLEGDFDDLLPGESLFYAEPMSAEEMEVF